MDALLAGEELIGTLKVVAIGEERETWNVVAETKGGDPNNVIVVRFRLIMIALHDMINGHHPLPPPLPPRIVIIIIIILLLLFYFDILKLNRVIVRSPS